MSGIAKKSSLFIRQSVIGFGFLSGIFTAIGIDPEEAILALAGTAIVAVWPDPRVISLFLILPTMLLLISVATAYRLGGLTGLVSVLVAYASGLAVFSSPHSTAIFLILAVFLGYLATNRRLLKKAGLR